MVPVADMLCERAAVEPYVSSPACPLNRGNIVSGNSGQAPGTSGVHWMERWEAPGRRDGIETLRKGAT